MRANSGFRHTGRFLTARLWVLPALVVGLGITPVWANQPPAAGPGQNALKTIPTTTPKPSTRTASGAKGPVSRQGVVPRVRLVAQTGKRDPFKLPPPPSVKGTGSVLEGAVGAQLPPGNRGLVISQLRLEGVVRENTSQRMIAVVTNETKRAYFLSENDSVYNGVVSKITPDAVYFNENDLDESGRVSTREVIKRLGVAPGEGR
jgi:hypothetical protein